MTTPTVVIQTDGISVVDAKILGATFLSAVNAFYADPQNVSKFKKWQEQRQQKMKNHGGDNYGK